MNSSEKVEPLMMPTEIPSINWPRPCDQLFIEDANWQCNAFPNAKRSDWDFIASGYKNAADILIERLVNDEQIKRVAKDWKQAQQSVGIIFPAVFAYRHCLELRLKGLIVDGRSLLDQAAETFTDHSLMSLWDTFRKISEQVFPGDPDPDDVLNSVESCIRQFSQIDPTSQVFRYPARKGGEPTLEGMPPISLLNIRDVMDRISNFLESSSCAFGDRLDQKRDFDRDIEDFYH